MTARKTECRATIESVRQIGQLSQNIPLTILIIDRGKKALSDKSQREQRTEKL